MDRQIKSYKQVKTMLDSASPAWEKLLGYIRYHYIVDEKWAEGKPTHKHYNNLFIRRGGKSFIGLSIREGYFSATITLGRTERDKFDGQRESFGDAVCEQYDAAEVLHDGKWLHFEIRDESLIDDIIHLLQIKSKPNRKVLPAKSLDKCGRLDIGLSHDEITNLISDTK